MFAIIAASDGPWDAPHWGGSHAGFMGGPHPGPFVIVIALLILLLIGGLVFALVRRRGPVAGVTAPRSAVSSAEQILAERFARGEVEEGEYRARLEALRANRPDA